MKSANEHGSSHLLGSTLVMKDEDLAIRKHYNYSFVFIFKPCLFKNILYLSNKETSD